jgi:ArsR family transcriptional regulator
MDMEKEPFEGDAQSEAEANAASGEDKGNLQRIANVQPPDEILYELAELFKVFGDSTRIRILYVLFEQELCVGDIAELLNMSQSSVSHQLRILKDAKLVKFRREGKSIFYALDDEHVYHMIEMGMEHVEE